MIQTPYLAVDDASIDALKREKNLPDCKKRSYPATHDVLIRPAKTVASDH